MRHCITVEDETAVGAQWTPLLTKTIAGALAALGAGLPCEVNVLLTDLDGMREINRDQRGVDKPTDVLSFPFFTYTPGELPRKEQIDPGGDTVPLGEIVLCLPRVAEQAAEYGHGIERELSYLTVHSVLHLLGYDHMDEGAQKAQMRAKEEELLEELKNDE